MYNINLQKWYTRIIGIYFVFILVSLVVDFFEFGYRLETWHKIFHVFIGVFVIYYGWNNPKFWRTFCLVNGAFFSFVALFGFVWSDLGMPDLEAFGLEDRILHNIVGVSGLVIGSFINARK